MFGFGNDVSRSVGSDGIFNAQVASADCLCECAISGFRVLAEPFAVWRDLGSALAFWFFASNKSFSRFKLNLSRRRRIVEGFVIPKERIAVVGFKSSDLLISAAIARK